MFSAGAVGQESPGTKRSMRAHAFAALLAAWCCQAQADLPEAVEAAADLPRPQLEVSSSPALQLDPAEAGVRASRLDITLLPQQRSGVGLAMGIRSRSRALPGLAPDIALPPAVDVGVHWRYTTAGNSHRFDVTAYRRAPAQDATSLVESRDPAYGARVEMGLASPKDLRKGFVADRGFVGLQLESGARLTIRRKFGGPMIYYRNTFY